MRRTPSIWKQLETAWKPVFSGKIEQMPVGWKHSDAGFTNSQGVYFKSTTDDNGDAVSMYQRWSVRCPSSEVGGLRPKMRGRYSVPLSECKKCPHRLKGGCCALLRDIARNGRPTP